MHHPTCKLKAGALHGLKDKHLIPGSRRGLDVLSKKLKCNATCLPMLFLMIV